MQGAVLSPHLELLGESFESVVETLERVPDVVHLRAFEQDRLTTGGTSEIGLSIVPSERLIEYVAALRATQNS
jgi:hypothetical protein